MLFRWASAQAVPTSGDVGVPFLGYAICCILGGIFSAGVVMASLGWALRFSVGRVSGGLWAFAVGFVLVHGTACVFHSSVNVLACVKPKGLLLVPVLYTLRVVLVCLD